MKRAAWLWLILGPLLFIMLMPGCGRTSLEPETLDGGTTPTPGNCSATTCPTGCCDAAGICRNGTDTRTCGSAGNRCSDCISNGFTSCTGSRVCGRVDPTCSAASCPDGCCGTEGGRLQCLSGSDASACGRRGGQCINCTVQGRACNASTRSCGDTSCNASNCKGCCVGDRCLDGTSTATCGAGGNACLTCGVGQTCTGGSCRGQTTCAQSCGGCCDGLGRCNNGTENSACGISGNSCSVCPPNTFCDQFSHSCQPISQGCNAGNCPGCCIGEICIFDTSSAFCGIKGQACQSCNVGELCTPNGTCENTSLCGPDNCPSGCCIGDVCAFGTQNNACGNFGQQCQNCALQGTTCSGQACAPPPCGPANCKGCCSAAGVCVDNGIDNDGACGVGGGACQSCSALNQVCEGGACQTPCNAQTCPFGCCQGNTCQQGFSTQACGQGGVQCQNCFGSFCNTLVSPRVCNTQQNTCPASYGQCTAPALQPITPQNICTSLELQSLATAGACANGPDSPTCVAAFNALSADCRRCLTPFHHPFNQRAGLYACAAAANGVGNGCRGNMACAIDCTQSSCRQCSSSTEDQCYSLVTNGNGQCQQVWGQAERCSANALAVNQPCSQFTYGDYAGWISNVGLRFCGTP